MGALPASLRPVTLRAGTTVIVKFSVTYVRASSEFSLSTKLPASLDLSHCLPQRSPLDHRLVLVLRAGCSLQFQPHDRRKQLPLPQISFTGRKGESAPQQRQGSWFTAVLDIPRALIFFTSLHASITECLEHGTECLEHGMSLVLNAWAVFSLQPSSGASNHKIITQPWIQWKCKQMADTGHV